MFAREGIYPWKAQVAQSLKNLCKSRYLNATGEKWTDLKIIVENIYILQQEENYFLTINIYHLIRNHSCSYIYESPILKRTFANDVRIFLSLIQMFMWIKNVGVNIALSIHKIKPEKSTFCHCTRKPVHILLAIIIIYAKSSVNIKNRWRQYLHKNSRVIMHIPVIFAHANNDTGAIICVC